MFILVESIKMLDKSTKIREEIKTSKNGNNYITEVFLCVRCPKEIFIPKSKKKESTGYCRECFNKHYKIDTRPQRDTILCNICDRNLPLDSFSLNKTGYHVNSCKKCSNLRELGITSIQYEEMLKSQNGVCAICHLPETTVDKRTNKVRDLAVDHDHSTGKIRELLCSKCNHAIGLLKESLDNLQSAMNYLKFHKGG
jgi:hypothetical protein